MKHIVELSEADIREVIAIHFDVAPAHISIKGTPAQDDGPGRHTPALVTATITDSKPIQEGGSNG